MKSLADLKLGSHEKLAIEEASSLLKEKFSAAGVVLFGSKARGDDDEESDIDLLVLTPRPVSWEERKAINDALYDIQLTHDVLLSTLIVTVKEWRQGPFSVLPIHQEISERGVNA